jgi:hypothetical protein
VISKLKRSAITLGLGIAVALPAATGVIPIKVGQIQNQSPVSAYSGPEHPWGGNRGWKSQSDGDAFCRNTFNNFARNYYGDFANDGRWFWVGNVWHVWYHQANQQCVLNFN